MEDKKEEKRYKIEKIESGIKDATLYESAKTAMSVGLIVAAVAVSYMLHTYYNMNTMMENVSGLILGGTAFISFDKAICGMLNLMNLGELGHIVKKREKEGEESLDFNELKFSEHSLHDMDDTNGPLKNVILNGFFKEENEDTSKRRQK